jgi:hypothetical protein
LCCQQLLLLEWQGCCFCEVQQAQLQHCTVHMPLQALELLQPHVNSSSTVLQITQYRINGRVLLLLLLLLASR